MNLHFIAYVNGILLIILSCLLGLTGLTGLIPMGSGGLAFFGAALTTLFFGCQLYFGHRHYKKRQSIDIHTGYFLTVSCWITTALFSSLPFYFGPLDLSFTDAMFETVSAMTTTGSTVLSGLDSMPHDILLWRSLLQWMGGIGIVVMAIAILPLLRVGGMNLFKSESSDISEKVISRLDFFVKITVGTYIGFTAVCALLLYLAGMSYFDAINHAMTTLSTGGFSTHDASVGFFNSPKIENIITLFMMIGSMPVIMYAHFFFSGRKGLSPEHYAQIKGLFFIWSTFIVVITLDNWMANSLSLTHSFRITLFQVTSVLSSTGFATVDFTHWGPFAACGFFFLMFIGGCAGSTTGAVKIFRWQLLFKGIYSQFLKNLSPNRITNIRYGGKKVSENIMHSVRNFLFLYILTVVFVALALSGCGLDFKTSLSGSAQAIGNIGPGLGDIIGPSGNFSTIPSTAKWVLNFAMIVGRLELFTLYALFMPAFWQR